MTTLEKIRQWLKAFPGYDQLKSLEVDYTPPSPGNGSVMPGGLLEVSRTQDILGNTTVVNQYNFTLFFTFLKSPGDDTGSTENAQWLLDLQDWVQAQSITGKAPTFGDEAKKETINAQNGTLYGTDSEGTALYTVQLSVQFIRKYEEENTWLN